MQNLDLSQQFTSDGKIPPVTFNNLSKTGWGTPCNYALCTPLLNCPLKLPSNTDYPPAPRVR